MSEAIHPQSETQSEPLITDLGHLAVAQSEIVSGPETFDEYTARLEANYQPFAASIQDIKDRIGATALNKIPGYLASGNESDVFTIEQDGVTYAARISKSAADGDARRSADHIAAYLEGPFRASGIRGTERLVSMSYEEGVTVAEMLPGKPMSLYSAEAIASIPREQYQDLARTVIDAGRAGIRIDGNEGNILYDVERGFSLLDFHLLDFHAADSENRRIGQPVTNAVFGTDRWLPHGELPVSEHAEDYMTLREVLQVTLPAYERWLGILADTQSGLGLGDGYLEQIDELKETAANMRTALATLDADGAITALVDQARDARQAAIGRLQTQVDEMEPGFMRDNKLATLKRRQEMPGPVFPNGSLRPTRRLKR